jgi:hypothetical protein
MSYVTRDNNQTSFFITYGTKDDIVDPGTNRRLLSLHLSRPIPVRRRSCLTAFLDGRADG